MQQKQKPQPKVTYTNSLSDRNQAARTARNKQLAIERDARLKEQIAARKLKKKVEHGKGRRQRRWGLPRQSKSTPATNKYVEFNVAWETLKGCGLV